MPVVQFGGEEILFGGQLVNFGASNMSKILVDFGVAGQQSPTPWNNIDDLGIGVKIADAIDDSGSNTGVSFEFQQSWQSQVDQGVTASVRSWPAAAVTDFFNTTTEVARRTVIEFPAAHVGVEHTFYIWGATTSTDSNRTGRFDLKDSTEALLATGTHNASNSGAAPPLELTVVVPGDGVVYFDAYKAGGFLIAAYLSVLEIDYALSGESADAPVLTSPYPYRCDRLGDVVSIPSLFTGASGYDSENLPKGCVIDAGTGEISGVVESLVSGAPAVIALSESSLGVRAGIPWCVFDPVISLITVEDGVVTIDVNDIILSEGATVYLSPFGLITVRINGRSIGVISGLDASLIVDGVEIPSPTTLYLSPRGRLTDVPNGKPIANLVEGV